MTASAIFSACQDHGEACPDTYCTGRRYRYLLRWPTGVQNNRICLFALANPSTATPDKLDPTLTRCASFARDWDYGWMHVVNARAWRCTDPKDLPKDPEAIGESGGYINDVAVARDSEEADLVVCGWGRLAGPERAKRMLEILHRFGPPPQALRINRDGTPSHPLYLPRDLQPIPYRPEEFR